jgi:hypothetical protein
MSAPLDPTPAPPPVTSPASGDDARTARNRSRGFLRRHWVAAAIAAVVLLPALVITAWAGLAFAITYSEGDRVGYVQKLSRKGWLCKTWEGELAMVNLPGAMSERFAFTVRGDSVAAAINAAQGRRVALSYRQHRGLPGSCFGETEYFVRGVKVLDE